jgi:hypothetical protein
MELWQITEVQRATWEVEIWDTMLRVSRKDYQIGINRNTERGDCVFWSKRSRMAMLRFINRVNWEAIKGGVFITLTYPDDEIAFTIKRRSRDRAYFALQLERQLCTELPIIWRTEFEERKSGKYTGRLIPHHHLMLCASVNCSQSLAFSLWRKCINSKNINLQVRAQKMTGANGCAKYLAKYVSKYRHLDIGAYRNTPCEFGRQWGVLRAKLMPMLSSEKHVL